MSYLNDELGKDNLTYLLIDELVQLRRTDKDSKTVVEDEIKRRINLIDKRYNSLPIPDMLDILKLTEIKSRYGPSSIANIKLYRHIFIKYGINCLNKARIPYPNNGIIIKDYLINIIDTIIRSNRLSESNAKIYNNIKTNVIVSSHDMTNFENELIHILGIDINYHAYPLNLNLYYRLKPGFVKTHIDKHNEVAIDLNDNQYGCIMPYSTFEIINNLRYSTFDILNDERLSRNDINFIKYFATNEIKTYISESLNNTLRFLLR